MLTSDKCMSKRCEITQSALSKLYKKQPPFLQTEGIFKLWKRKEICKIPEATY